MGNDQSIERARKRLERAKAVFELAESRAAARERKIDMRRAVIVGKLVLEAIKEEKNLGVEGAPAESLVVSLMRGLRERDRALFSDLMPPPPPPSLPIFVLDDPAPNVPF